MSAPKRRRTLATALGPTADGVPVNPLSAPQAAVPVPGDSQIPTDPGTAGGVDTGPAVAGPVPAPRVRLADAELPADVRAEWRHRLRAASGKLASAHRAVQDAERTWARVTAEARAAGVPEVMILAALADAGLSPG